MIKDLAEFERLLKICRKQGISELRIGEVSVTFGEAPRKKREDDEGDAEIPTDTLSPEQLMFYSAGGQ